MGMASFHLRANVRKSCRQFPTYLFPKWVTDNCSAGIKLHTSRKGTGSQMHLGGNIYNKEKTSFVNRRKMKDTPSVFLISDPQQFQKCLFLPKKFSYRGNLVMYSESFFECLEQLKGLARGRSSVIRELDLRLQLSCFPKTILGQTFQNSCWRNILQKYSYIDLNIKKLY